MRKMSQKLLIMVSRAFMSIGITSVWRF
jgi:hypothetical protein